MASRQTALSPRRTLASLGLLVLAALAWLPLPEALAASTLDATLASAFQSFALAKALNAVISVLQSVTGDALLVQIQFGEVLDPANDMVERFSWVMFASTVSLAFQKLLLGIAGSVPVKAALSLGCVAMLTVLHLGKPGWRGIAGRLLIVAAFLRFAVIAVALASAGVETLYITDSREALYSELEQDKAVLERIADQTTSEDEVVADDAQGEDQGWWQSLKDRLGNGVKDRVQAAMDRFDAMTRNLVELTMLFLVQTMLMPLGFLYLSYRGARYLAAGITRSPRHPPALTQT
ncbi:hypothetical protein SAMN05216571_103397 [Onishia taeanensis]|uniref:TrbL/VirB6 plasmid conjugal transfer protein n=1 Tax=Onishia taeanensis TaxID=284577 RepID=A0A1G7QQW2_9GAMM|nr:hypothetical protein [Halomonas taeanensis]SDG00898.1 hypothetical protein SAMN05216571_103397 [Halomonas taeanensis]